MPYEAWNAGTLPQGAYIDAVPGTHCWQQARKGLRYRMAHDFWFAKMMSATREGRAFTEPEPRIEDYVS